MASFWDGTEMITSKMCNGVYKFPGPGLGYLRPPYCVSSFNILLVLLYVNTSSNYIVNKLLNPIVSIT